jgi:hypothetical protein
MRKLLATAVLVLTALGFATPAAAGGWAVTTLDPLAAAPIAGEPFAVGFTIRQHGQTPINVPDAAIIVTATDGTSTRFAATPQGALGHHVATVDLPTDGTYTWAVEQDIFGIQDLGTLQVGPAATADAGGGDDSSPWTLPLFVVAAVLAALGVADLGRSTLARRRHAAAA